MSPLNSGAAKNADLGTHEGLAGRRSLSCSFVYLKDSKIFSGIQNFASKMSDCIKFQKHMLFNYIISLKLDIVYFAYCKEYQRSNQASLNPVVSITRLTICKMMQFGTTTVKKQKMQKMLLRLKAKAKVEIISTCPQVRHFRATKSDEVNNEHSLP